MCFKTTDTHTLLHADSHHPHHMSRGILLSPNCYATCTSAPNRTPSSTDHLTCLGHSDVTEATPAPPYNKPITICCIHPEPAPNMGESATKGIGTDDRHIQSIQRQSGQAAQKDPPPDGEPTPTQTNARLPQEPQPPQPTQSGRRTPVSTTPQHPWHNMPHGSKSGQPPQISHSTPLYAKSAMPPTWGKQVAPSGPDSPNTSRTSPPDPLMHHYLRCKRECYWIARLGNTTPDILNKIISEALHGSEDTSSWASNNGSSCTGSISDDDDNKSQP